MKSIDERLIGYVPMEPSDSGGQPGGSPMTENQARALVGDKPLDPRVAGAELRGCGDGRRARPIRP
jgi:hypothetical protein